MIRTQTTVGTRIHTRTMAEMMRTRILSSYTAGTFHTYTDTDCCTRRIRNGPADMHADVLCD
jgi:hypothetical protein